MKNINILLCFAILCMACDPYDNARHGMVNFSSDTVYFDTVFTSIGSVTKEFRAINSTGNALLIDRIYLGGGDSSPFRLNINGRPVSDVTDVIIPSRDSIFIFIDVTVDPGDEDSPVAVRDSVVFDSGGTIRRVIVEAWGQDIWLFENEVIGDMVFSAGKPYVIYGSLLVDTTAILTIKQGTRIYLHHNASMTIAGTLITEGTALEPVLIASDRITPEYEDIPGQWDRISFIDCSSGNILKNTEVRNAVTGVEIRGGPSGTPDILILNTKLIHHSVSSLYATAADVFSVNSLYAHTGFSSVTLTDGGNYDFIHCTISNFWEYDFRIEPAFYIGKGSEEIMPVVSVKNSVIYGTLENELFIDATPGEVGINVLADSSVIKVDTLTSPWWNRASFISVITDANDIFISESEYDYRPDTLSVLVDVAGKTESLTWPFDIRNKFRPAGNGPDIGAYERQAGEKRIKN